MFSMVLSGWKDIANYLKLGVRTVQRWENHGLPVNRPYPGRRSHVVAYSEQLDDWVQRKKLGGNGSRDLLLSLEQARKLRSEIQLATRKLHSNVEGLRAEMKLLRSKRRGGDG
jgi:phage terminase Nu1 subunit (DNA packaging protein)